MATRTQTAAAAIEGFRGRLIAPGDPDYDSQRALWNVMHDRRPALIARCAGPHDVAAAIAHARSHGLRIAVRGGGHSLPGFSSVDGGLVIDLRELCAVSVDPERRRVRVGGGALLGDVDRAVQAHGLVVPSGVVSHTGVGGLTLGGGVGRLMRRFGLTIDSLLGAEVVLADGRIVRAAPEGQHAELFWALRGGGGNFGVVTEFEFAAHELSELAVLATFHPLERAGEVLALAQRTIAAPATPDALLWTSFLRRGPAEAPWLPRELVGTRGVMSLIEWSGDPAEAGRPLLEGIATELAAPASELAVVPYLAIQSITDELLAPGTLSAYIKAGYADALGPQLIAGLLDRGARVGSDLSVIEVLAVGGAIRDVADAATAFPHRGASWLINIVGQWPGARGDMRDSEIAWVRESHAALEPQLGHGAYSNFMPEGEPGAAEAAYGPTLARLREIKAVYDPANVFALNQNIAPAGAR